MTEPDTITTGDGRTIPPPTEVDLAIGLLSRYSVLHDWLDSDRCEMATIRRCHAAEAAVRRQAEDIVQVCAERDALFGEVIARDSEIASLRERVAELENVVAESQMATMPKVTDTDLAEIREVIASGLILGPETTS